MYVVSIIDYRYSDYNPIPVGVFYTEEEAEFAVKEWINQQTDMLYDYNIERVEIGKINY